jgi:hypothetical protein
MPTEAAVALVIDLNTVKLVSIKQIKGIEYEFFTADWRATARVTGNMEESYLVSIVSIEPEVSADKSAEIAGLIGEAYIRRVKAHVPVMVMYRRQLLWKKPFPRKVYPVI